MPKIRPPATLLALLAVVQLAAAQQAVPPSLSEIPATFTPKTDAFDHVRRDEMVAMRDGVKLRTLVFVPKGVKDAPILLARTPYNAAERMSRTKSSKLINVAPQMMDTAAEAGYILVYQDVRGKHGSEGDYVMNRPLRGPLNATGTDHATDTYDTIDWLVKNVPESNGRVATIGGSYEGFTVLMSTVRPHPALKAAVPFAPMVDGWMGDDWFHNGAFRGEGALEFTYNQQATRGSTEKWWTDADDTYEAW
jgi:putative CocE/NonD family hydrolase